MWWGRGWSADMRESTARAETAERVHRELGPELGHVRSRGKRDGDQETKRTGE